MQADLWKKVEELFRAAMAQPPEKRAEFLNQACPADPQIRAEVQSLLDAAPGAASFLDSSPLSSALTRGTKLGHFEILGSLGRGGMGEVYRARDSRLEREVAIKVLPESFVRDPDRIARFEREARAASALNHPNIVSVYDIGRENSTYWIVSELVDGETLRRTIDRGPLAARKAIEIAVQIAEGLAAAHAAGIVHRDLKPGNIMVTRAGRVKILDFGLAKREHLATDSSTRELTNEGTVLGTAGYMSPEQVRGEDVDYRSDIFSFGVNLYEILAGKQAFSGSSSIELMNAILKDDPPELPPSVPPSLERIVRRCLEKDPARRFHSAADLGFALASVSPSQPASAAAAVPSRRASLKLATAGVAAMGAALFWLTHSLPPPRVTGTEQITNDGSIKSYCLVTDGPRLYFYLQQGRLSYQGRTAQVSAKGGDPLVLPDVPQGMLPLDVSPDHSELLLSRLSPELTSVTSRTPLWVAPAFGGAPRRLGNLSLNIWSPARWSPNGDRIVYTEGKEIRLARSDGTELRKVATLQATPFEPCWSPDGEKIRFSTPNDAGTIWEISADGSHLHAVFPSWKVAQCCGKWTTDGKYFVFGALNKGTWSIWAVREKAGFFERGGHEPVQLTTGPMNAQLPTPSLDGKRIFFRGTLSAGELVRYDAKSTQWAPYLSGVSATRADFSRDRKWVTYVTFPERSLWRSAADGSQRRQLTSPPMSDVGSPRWSPDGTQIAFAAHTAGGARAFVISAEGGAPRQVTNGESGPEGDIDPSWSPDGSTLVFSSFPSEHQLSPDNMLLRTVDLKTGRISTLPGSQGLWSPRWSPRGRFIAAEGGNESKLMFYDLETHQQIEMADTIGTGWPSWSTDGKFLYFVRGAIDASLVKDWCRIRIPGGRPERLADLKDFRMPDFWFGLSPENSLLSIRDTGTNEIYALDWEAP